MNDFQSEIPKRIRLVPSKESKITRKGNIVDIISGNDHFSIIYGVHFFANKSEQLPPNLEGLMLETGQINYVGDGFTTLAQLMSHPQYRELIPTIKSTGMPLFFGDVVVKKEVEPFLFVVSPAVEGVEVFTGAYIGRKIKRTLNKDVITRREFLGLGKNTALLTWLSSPTISRLLHTLASTTNVDQQITVPIRKANNIAHPELNVVLLKLRNAVLAYKQQYLMKNMGISHMGTVVGAEHIGLEENLIAQPQDLINIIKITKPIWERIVIPETIHTIKIHGSRNGNFTEPQEKSIPELEQLVG